MCLPCACLFMTPACRAVEQCSTGPGCAHGREGLPQHQSIFLLPKRDLFQSCLAASCQGGKITAAMIFGDAEHGEAGRIRVWVAASPIFGGFSQPLQRFLLCFHLPPPWVGVGVEPRSLNTHFVHPGQGGSCPHTALCRWGLAFSEPCARSCLCQRDTQDPGAAPQCSGCAPASRSARANPSSAHGQG